MRRLERQVLRGVAATAQSRGGRGVGSGATELRGVAAAGRVGWEPREERGGGWSGTWVRSGGCLGGRREGEEREKLEEGEGEGMAAAAFCEQGETDRTTNE